MWHFANSLIFNTEDIYVRNVKKRIKVHEYRIGNKYNLMLGKNDMMFLTTRDYSNYETVYITKQPIIYHSWREAFENTENYLDDFTGVATNMEEALEAVSKFYTEEEIAKCGIIVYDIKVCPYPEEYDFENHKHIEIDWKERNKDL